ncbi:hypothetical protein Scep_022361 [Stephania cephalantha]|uniref:Uncharacterized protein n=1 Tax=Stephania cephalantha TaxID=152367 RepID=A0AAP0F7V9_9MAGN
MEGLRSWVSGAQIETQARHFEVRDFSRRIELTQWQPVTPIDETDLYLSVVERDDKGRTYGLGWTPLGSRRRYATVGGAGGGDGAGSSRPISSPNEPVELLRRDFQTMQTHIFRVMHDHTLTQYQLREVQGQLRRMEQALMDRLGISFAPPTGCLPLVKQQRINDNASAFRFASKMNAGTRNMMFNDKILKINVRRCISTAIKLRKKYLYKSVALSVGDWFFDRVGVSAIDCPYPCDNTI